MRYWTTGLACLYLSCACCWYEEEGGESLLMESVSAKARFTTPAKSELSDWIWNERGNHTWIRNVGEWRRGCGHWGDHNVWSLGGALKIWRIHFLREMYLYTAFIINKLRVYGNWKGVNSSEYYEEDQFFLHSPATFRLIDAIYFTQLCFSP